MEGHSLQQPALRYGVPQGSVIAPLLFSIMLYDINKTLKHDAIITLYADDLAIWKETKCRKFSNITIVMFTSAFHRASVGVSVQLLGPAVPQEQNL